MEHSNLDVHIWNAVPHLAVTATKNLIALVKRPVPARQNPAAWETLVDRPTPAVVPALTTPVRLANQVMTVLCESLETNLLVRVLRHIAQVELEVSTVVCRRVVLDVRHLTRREFTHERTGFGRPKLAPLHVIIISHRVAADAEATAINTARLHRLVLRPRVPAAVVPHRASPARVRAHRAIVDRCVGVHHAGMDVSLAVEPTAKPRIRKHTVRRGEPEQGGRRREHHACASALHRGLRKLRAQGLGHTQEGR